MTKDTGHIAIKNEFVNVMGSEFYYVPKRTVFFTTSNIALVKTSGDIYLDNFHTDLHVKWFNQIVKLWIKKKELYSMVLITL